MPVPVSVLIEVGKFLFDEYTRIRSEGREEMTDEEWTLFESKIKERRDVAWARFRSAKNPDIKGPDG